MGNKEDSDTKQVCTCGWFERMAAEPHTPIEYDAITNEYLLVSERPASRGYAILRYCPGCGGSAPESRRGSLFATLTDAERSRLVQLTTGLTTFAKVVEALGEPDHDSPAGYVETRPGTDTTPERTTVHRTLVYEKLSETARVRFTDLHDGTVSVSFGGKYVGPTRGGGKTG